MKILFISENYYPMVSGVPVVVRYLAEGLSQKNYQVCVATQRPQGTAANELIDGVEVNRFNISRNRLFRYSGQIQGYVDYVVNSNADVLILECSECFTTDLILPYLNNVKSKVLFHSHGMSGFNAKFFAIKDSLKHTLGTTYNWFNSKLYFKFTFKKSFEFIDAFICLSELDSGIEYVKKYAKKVCILDNACNNMFFNDSSSNVLYKYANLENDFYMMSCANYSVVKNQKEMIRQYYQSDSSRKYSLVCIGSQDNQYYKECLQLVTKMEKKYGHRDVVLLLNVERCDIPSILKGASLYLVSSMLEQYSISIIEAMSLGVPFISTNVGNARLLPGGKTINNVNQLHIHIDMLLDNMEEYKEYSKKGKSFAYNNCRVDAVVDRLEDIINNLFVESN